MKLLISHLRRRSRLTMLVSCGTSSICTVHVRVVLRRIDITKTLSIFQFRVWFPRLFPWLLLTTTFRRTSIAIADDTFPTRERAECAISSYQLYHDESSGKLSNECERDGLWFSDTERTCALSTDGPTDRRVYVSGSPLLSHDVV